MTDFVEKVRQFNAIAGTDEVFDVRKVALYIGLCLEELAELIEAIPSNHYLKNNRELSTLIYDLDRASTMFKDGDFDSHVAGIDRVGAVDAFVDLAVVSLGGTIASGADVNGACHAVADNNLSKFPQDKDGKRYALKDENGKVKKPEGFKPVNLSPFLKF